jgi:hypothetical protein
MPLADLPPVTPLLNRLLAFGLRSRRLEIESGVRGVAQSHLGKKTHRQGVACQ